MLVKKNVSKKNELGQQINQDSVYHEYVENEKFNVIR